MLKILLVKKQISSFRKPNSKRRQIIAEAERQLREGCEKYAVIRNEVAVFKARMESLLNSQMQMVDGYVLGDSKVQLEKVNIDEVIAAAAEDNSTIHSNAGVAEDVLAAQAAVEQAEEAASTETSEDNKINRVLIALILYQADF